MQLLCPSLIFSCGSKDPTITPDPAQDVPPVVYSPRESPPKPLPPLRDPLAFPNILRDPLWEYSYNPSDVKLLTATIPGFGLNAGDYNGDLAWARDHGGIASVERYQREPYKAKLNPQNPNPDFEERFINWLASSEVNAFLPPDQPSYTLHAKDGSTLYILSPGPTSADLVGQALAILSLTGLPGESQACELGQNAPGTTVGDVLKNGGKSIGPPGRSRGVVTVGSEAELQGVFKELTQGGTVVPSGTYPGTVVKMPDGSFVRMRGGSRSGGATIDITGADGKTLKVHIDPP